MGTIVEVEVDDAHEFMIKKMTEDDTSIEEFVSNMVDQTIYSAYQQNKAVEEQQGQPSE